MYSIVSFIIFLSPNSIIHLIPSAPTLLLNMSPSSSYNSQFSRKCSTVSFPAPHSNFGVLLRLVNHNSNIECGWTSQFPPPPTSFLRSSFFSLIEALPPLFQLFPYLLCLLNSVRWMHWIYGQTLNGYVLLVGLKKAWGCLTAGLWTPSLMYVYQ